MQMPIKMDLILEGFPGYARPLQGRSGNGAIILGADITRIPAVPSSEPMDQYGIWLPTHETSIRLLYPALRKLETNDGNKLDAYDDYRQPVGGGVFIFSDLFSLSKQDMQHMQQSIPKAIAIALLTMS